MAATVSSVWAKPGAWALDCEEHEKDLKREIETQQSHNHVPESPDGDFPSLTAAASAKPKKKKKGQTLSLAEFSNYGSTAPKPAERLTQDELLMLPTGPRERTAEELDRTRLGGGFRNYGGGESSRGRFSERNKEGYANSNRERDSGPSRADEVDDWSRTKKLGSFGGGERPERRDKGGFFNSSRADEVDNWAYNKSFGPPPSDRRERRMGFESYSNGSGPDSGNWLNRREEKAVDSDTWGWKKEEGRENGNGNGNGNDVGRPRLNLQPRTLPVASNGQNQGQASTEGVKPKGANPFGEARPREEVLAEKGKDWKEIDEKLEAVKIKEVSDGEKGEGFSRRRGFGLGRLESGDERTVMNWRRPESNGAVPTPSSVVETEVVAEITENTDATENAPKHN